MQSGSHLPDDLLLRFELFLEDFTKRIFDILPKERFEHLKTVQITNLQMPPDSLHDMASLLRFLAFTQEGDFTRKEKQIKAIQSLTYEELIEDAQRFFTKKNLRRLAVLLQGQQLESKPFLYEHTNKEEVLKISSFGDLR